MVATERVDLTVAEGEFLTFLGPSGSGKSTTLYILAGFEDPTSGDIRLKGRSLIPVPPHRRNIGMVFQRYTLFPHLSVGENVAFPLRVRKLPDADVTRRVRAALDLVRLSGMEDRMPAKMSGGQQQRVALARALVYEPPLLLMDEPLSALDKKLREEIQFEIRRIHQETGVTILYVTHDQEEAMRLSDRIAVFRAGRVEQVGTGAELYGNPASRFVAEFMGSSSFLTATVEAVEAGGAALRLAGGERLAGVALHGTATAGASVKLLLRPERLTLTRLPAGGVASLPVAVADVTFLGNETDVRGRTAWGEDVFVRLPYGDPLAGSVRPGETVHLGFNPDTVQAFAE